VLLRKKRIPKRLFFSLAAAFISLCLLSTDVTAKSFDTSRVLVLHSYHPTYRWTGFIMQGIESVLEPYEGKIIVDVEYMDSRRVSDPVHYDNLYATYRHKSKYKKYDVVITSDNNALAFILRHRDELYPNVPVVFCGISNFQEAMIAGHDAVTGITEDMIIKPTIEIALQFHPAAKKIVFVVNGNSSQNKLARMDRAIAEISRESTRPLRFHKRFISQSDYSQFLEAVTGLNDESIVIFASAFRDDKTYLYSFENGITMVQEKCSAPIYALTEQWFGYVPIIGGRINSGFHQGQAAAEMALRILEGQNPSDMPVVKSGVDKYIFDYIQLKRFGIAPSKIPKDSIIINEPKSFYHLYKKHIWMTATVILVLVVIVVLLTGNILRRLRAEKKLLDYQAKLKSLTSELSLAEEHERRRIAIELHDCINQSLVISKVNLEQLRQSTSSNAAVSESLNEICSLLGRIIQDIRSLTFDLSSPILYELGFEAAVSEWIDEQIRQGYGIETEFQDDGRPKVLDEDLKVILFRSVKELLFNVVKHAKASKVSVLTRKVNGRIHISVQDDGVGFKASKLHSVTAKTGGFGLFSIKEQLEQAGGTLHIDTGPGRGTTVTMIAPVDVKKTFARNDNEYKDYAG